MAITSENKLFPPIIDTYKPAFVMDDSQGINIFFDFSPYMDTSKTTYAQITLTQQNNNTTVFKNVYSMQIKRQQVQFSSISGKPFITINITDLKDGVFLLNTYYKLQIRLDQIDDTITNPNSDWINTNLTKFSEWSAVCLIRRIATPHIYLWNTEIQENDSIQISSIPQINGYIKFFDSSGEDTETLRRYQLILRDQNNNIVETSDIIYTNIYQNPNEINYIFKTFLAKGKYNLDIRFETKNYYTDQKTVNIEVSSETKSLDNIDIKIVSDEDCARNKIILTSSDKIIGLYEIARASEDSNFNVWTIIQNFNFKENDWNDGGSFISNITTEESIKSEINSNNNVSVMIYHNNISPSGATLQSYTFVLADQTIEGGVRYKYRIQKREGVNIFTKESNIVLNMFENIFLISNNKNLKIGFNENISSIKPVLSISKIDTIGGQFPFIKKNANMNYRQFNISGLISVLADKNETFIKKDLLFGGANYNAHEEYVKENNISQFNDYILERKYRDAVIKYLTDGNTKLLKSLTEGNILVQLTDVNLTPQQSLGRYIYSFSATAYEVDEANEDNYIKHNIQPLEVDISTINYYLVTTNNEYIETTDEEKLSVNIREG